ncbi:MAG: JAB domain-containing protein [Planctomycetota bacterium]|jgi:DNA repair protein RadC|nr:JAB domain-containing protein [Planctomycetota bacterium]
MATINIPSSHDIPSTAFLSDPSVSAYSHMPIGDLVALIAGRSPRRIDPALRDRCAELSVDYRGQLDSYSQTQLAATFGLSKSGKQRLAAAIALHQRLVRAERPVPSKILTPEDVAVVMAPFASLDHERIWCLPLDARSNLIGTPILVSTGDVDGADGSPRMVFRAAVRVGAVSVIIVHNHPSGDTSPSQADLALTKRWFSVGRMLDLALNDHCIISPNAPLLSLRRTRPELFTS